MIDITRLRVIENQIIPLFYTYRLKMIRLIIPHDIRIAYILQHES